MPDLDIVPCKHCGADLAVSRGRQPVPQYHQACAWYELPCAICGKPMSIHRDWENPPRAHKACKDAATSKWYTKPCDYCGGNLRVHVNAVKVPKFHKKCAGKAQKTALPMGASSKHRLRVFLCHSSSDKAKVRELCRRLRADGVTPWLDEEELLPGQDWHREITRAVRSSHVVIVCLSGTAISKVGYVQKEIKHALDVADEQPEGTIFLIPLKLEECDTPERLQRWQWVKLFEESGYERLMRALRERGGALGLG